MNVIGGDAVVQQPNLILLEMFPQFLSIPVPVTRELEQEFPVMASMGNVKDAPLPPSAPNPVCPGHGSREYLTRLFRYSGKTGQKIAAKPSEPMATKVRWIRRS